MWIGLPASSGTRRITDLRRLHPHRLGSCRPLRAERLGQVEAVVADRQGRLFADFAQLM